MKDETISQHSAANIPSRLNGETIAGAAFLFFSFLFLMAGLVNPVFAGIYPVDFMLLAVGVALQVLGYRTHRNAVLQATGRAKKSGRY